MTDQTPAPDWYDAGCRRECSEQHTYRWGDCAFAPESARPAPTVSMSVVYQDTDGYPSIGFDTYTVEQLADLIEPAINESEGGWANPYDSDYGRWRAAKAAKAIIHRNDPAPSSTQPGPAATEATEPATITDPEWLRQQYAAAIQPLLMDNLPKPIAAARAREIADTVLFVHDRHLAQLRQRLQLADIDLGDAQPELDRLREQIKEAEAQCREWEDTAYRHAKHWRDEQEASHRLLTQRQELAAERYVWQERGDQLAITLQEVLAHFTHETHPGQRCLQTGHVPVGTVERWRTALTPPKEPTP